MSHIDINVHETLEAIPSEWERYLFHEGTFYQSDRMLGAHVMTVEGRTGVRFAVWAPHAKQVNVVGDFNDWQGQAHAMIKIPQSGIWYLFIPGLKEGDLYKYEIHTQDHHTFLKSDPYAFYSEVRPNTASIVYSLERYDWQDDSWLNQRKRTDVYHQPVFIYEVHLGSWKKKEDGTFLTYRELAHDLVDYVVERGYTHLELMPVMEHPYDRSWGYQVTGYFSVTSRYGTPEDFMYFVDRCHKLGIGVILDWVPVHFCKDAHGLGRFDGTPLFEPQNPERAERENWGTYNFDFSKPEISSFLISNLLFWLRTYHIDGFRVDAVSHMIYLNHDRQSSHPLYNQEGGDTHLEAIAFIKKMNEVVFNAYPEVFMIAEEATDWPLVTGRTDQGGLGFNYKWNMGWVHDVLSYMARDPYERSAHYHSLTFSLLYTYTDNFILPFSHDELVHGKRSLLNKMSGTYEEKFAQLRLLYSYFMTHPGKKLSFMGNEWAQFDEWKDLDQLDWELVQRFDAHRQFNQFEAELMTFYKEWPCFWRLDHEQEGFHWIEANAESNGVIAFIRQGKRNGDVAVIVGNFSRTHYQTYKIGVPSKGTYLEVFNTDCTRFGGRTDGPGQILTVDESPYQEQPNHIELQLPPLSLLVLMRETKTRSRRS